jgi:hypothetical protein
MAVQYAKAMGLNVIAENPGQVPYGESPYYIVVRDTDGNVYQQGNISRPQKVTVPILEQQTMAPGDRVSGIVGFVVWQRSPISSSVTGDTKPVSEAAAAPEFALKLDLSPD